MVAPLPAIPDGAGSRREAAFRQEMGRQNIPESDRLFLLRLENVYVFFFFFQKSYTGFIYL